MDIIPAKSSKSLTKCTTFANYILIVYAYSYITKLYGTESITTDKIMGKIDMFQEIFGKVDEFSWWDMERIQTYADTWFTYKEFQEGLSVRGLRLALAAQDHQ